PRSALKESSHAKLRLSSMSHCASHHAPASVKKMVNSLNQERVQAQRITDTLHGEIGELKEVLKKFGTQHGAMSQGQLKSELTSLLKNYQAKEKTLEHEVFCMTERYHILHTEYDSSLRARASLVSSLTRAEEVAAAHIGKLTQQNELLVKQIEREKTQPVSLKLAEELAGIKRQLNEKTLQNKDLFTDYQNLKFKHVAEISALKLEKDALVNRSNDLSSKLSEMTLSNQQLAAASEAANNSFCVASASSQTSGDVVISIPVTLTEIETQTEATNSRTASPANTPASPPETKPATAPSQEGAASASSTPTSKHRMLASAALAMQKSNGKLRCSLYLQKIFDAARAREGKRVLRCFARWARNVERGNREALQNDLLGASKRFREQLERVKGQFVEQIETMRRESEAARAKLSASNDRADKLEMENRVLRSSR
ncbi:hypothetical protein TrRE_jg11678, partial [Triparma retinervis]